MSEPEEVLVAAWEIEETVGAVEAASLLLELLVSGQFMDAEQDRHAPRLASALLHLAIERLRRLGSALRNGEAGDLIAEFNSAFDSPETRRVHAVILPRVRQTTEARPVIKKAAKSGKTR